MPDTIGNITVPEIAVSGTFPIIPEYALRATLGILARTVQS